jgi:superfamily II DNA/RNA helicase
MVSELRSRLGISSSEGDALTIEEIKFLLQAASILSFQAPNAETAHVADERGWAYDVSTRLADLVGNSNSQIANVADFILSRLGNFPGRELLRKRFQSRGEESKLRSPSLTLEALVREAENTVDYPGIGSRLLTDFQVRLASCLQRSKAVSVSAPTSAGKSFVLAHDILASIVSQPGTVLIYLVPTRALIQQVTIDLLGLFRDANLNEVVVAAAPVEFSEEQAKPGLVYVLTQERLVSLLSAPQFGLAVTKVYVDEAQEIGDDERGLILDSAIRELVRRYPAVRICFASPLTKNPGYMFEEFGIVSEGEFFTETLSPVAQVICNLEPVKGKPRAASVSVVTPTGIQQVGQVALSFKFSGVWERLAHTAIFVRKPDESAIVFANRPVDAMEIADKLAEQVVETTADKDVLDLIEFVKTHVHPRYALADTLSKGIAFHYGRMPHIIRSQIEELLRTRKLQYVVSTSTLLQGVNLPARHIIVLAPKEGNGKPMTTPDFWNLAGRAGRLRENFRGIVWCVDPSSWEAKPFEGDRLSEIKSAFQVFVQDSAVREASIAVLDAAAPIGMVEDRNRVEQFLGKAFSEFTIRNLKLSESPRVPADVRQELVQVDSGLEALRNRLKVPLDVCAKNAVISPTLLNDLWGRFEQGLSRSMIPIDPMQAGALEHFRTIFQVISEVFIGSTNNSWLYFSALGYRWVMGDSLKELIDNRLKFYRVASDRKAVNSAIRELLDAIEQTLRFTYVKYLKAYTDVLRAYLIQHERTDDAERIAPWDLYVEFGARDKVLLMLMSVGVSRSTAIAIRPAITQEREISREACWKRLLALPLKVLNVPAVCKAEIRQLTGSKS